MRPLFGDHKRAVDETLRQVKLAPLFEIVRQRLQKALERPVAHPPLEAAVAGLVWRVSFGHILPLGARAQNPEDSVQHLATATPGSPAAVRPSRHRPNQRIEYGPLLVGDVHRCCILLEDTAYHPFMR
jgi:hypothetical protein